MQIFGNDGFRSIYGQKYMKREFLMKFSYALTKYYYLNNCKLPVAMGRDTRESGKVIENIIIPPRNPIFSKLFYLNKGQN